MKSMDLCFDTQVVQDLEQVGVVFAGECTHRDADNGVFEMVGVAV
jgi:hypothetical protein